MQTTECLAPKLKISPISNPSCDHGLLVLCFSCGFQNQHTEILVCYLLQPPVNKYQDKAHVGRRPNVILLPTEELQTCL